MKTPWTFLRSALLCGAVVACTAPPAIAQSARYVRIALGSTELEPPGDRFHLSSVRYPAITLGWTSARGHGAELSVSRLDAEATEARHPLSEAPYTIGVRATTIDLAYFYQPSLGLGRVRPRVGVGLAVIPLVDRWSSDTPTESRGSTRFGATASVGLVGRVWAAASLAMRAAYHLADDEGDRPVRRVGLTGSRFEAGLEIAF